MTSGRQKTPEGAKEGVGAAAFAITVAFELLEGTFPEFHRLVAENAALSVKLEPDCLRFDVLTPADAAGSTHVFLYEIYRDRAAFDLHLTSEHFLQFDQRSRDLVISKTVLAYTVQENAKIGKST